MQNFFKLTILISAIAVLLSTTGSAQRKNTTRDNALRARQEAEKQAKQFWNSRMSRCSEDYFTSQRELIHQFRGVQIVVTSLDVSDADRLNGLQWRGRTSIRAAQSRSYSRKRTFSHDIGWGRWTQGLPSGMQMVGVNADIRKEGGRWMVIPQRISPASDFQPINCSEIP